jgi:hypothetical protein
MKHFLSLTIALLSIAAIAGASPVTFLDPWQQGSPDVIGLLEKFDIQKADVDVTASGVTVDIYTNFGPGTDGTSIAPYFDQNRWFNIGDLFFTVGGSLAYGVALYDHAVPNGGQSGSTVVAGTLYGINDIANGTLTASEALNGYTGNYRPDEIVLLRNEGSYLTNLGAGSVNVDTSGTNPEFKITVSIPQAVSSNFYSDMTGGAWGIHFASATCGNDVIDGRVPEPATFFLLGGALLGLGLLGRRMA